MNEKEIVVQCKLQSPSVEKPSSFFFYTAYIPKKFAIIGKKICIDAKEGIWTVKEVYSTKQLLQADQDSQDYKKHRKFSDI